MSTLYLILLIAGCACFLAAALRFEARVKFGWLGLFLVFLVPVIQRLNT